MSDISYVTRHEADTRAASSGTVYVGVRDCRFCRMPHVVARVASTDRWRWVSRHCVPSTVLSLMGLDRWGMAE